MICLLLIVLPMNSTISRQVLLLLYEMQPSVGTKPKEFLMLADLHWTLRIPNSMRTRDGLWLTVIIQTHLLSNAI